MNNVTDIRGALTSESLARGIAKRFWTEYSVRLDQVIDTLRQKYAAPARNEKAFQRKSAQIRADIAKRRSSLWAICNKTTPSNTKSKIAFFPVHSVGILRPVDGHRLELWTLIIPHPKSSMREAWLWLEPVGFVITRHAIERMIQRLRCQTLDEALLMLQPVTQFFFEDIYMIRHAKQDDGTFPPPHDNGITYTAEFLDSEDATKFSVEHRIGYSDELAKHYLATIIVDGSVVWEEIKANEPRKETN